MMNDSLRIFAPASVSNVGPGFDLMGFALENPGDLMLIKRNSTGKLRLFNQSSVSIPLDPTTNVASVAVLSLLKALDRQEGFDLVFEKKINPGSGIGSSAASCTAAVYGVNELLGRLFTPEQLITHALDGEFVASGSLHADNIAPAMLGGFVLVRGYDPIDIVKLKAPDNLLCVVVHPAIEIKTAESRKLIPKTIELKTALKQCGNIAGLVTGLTTGDLGLLSRSLHDSIAEPVRAHLIPGLELLKKRVMDAGALGTSISGSGPSVFALCHSPEIAENIASVMKQSFDEKNIENQVYISQICSRGTRVAE